jgi:type VI secretion system protein ImpK
MNLITPKKHPAMPVDIDSLFQDSYLLVVELRQGASVQDGRILRELCVKQVEHVRLMLEQTGLSPRSIDHISHAQCALLDETVLGHDNAKAREIWAGEPLQAKFFNRHQAGEFLFEDMRELLREPAPDQLVLTAFHRVLMLGFRGRYADVDDPERQQLLAALSAQVEPLAPGKTLATQVKAGQGMHLRLWPRTTIGHGLLVILLIVGVWWGLDQLLSGLVGSVLPGETR